MLSLHNINKTYYQGGVAINILRNVNLRIEAGELAAIIGVSGSGKSSLLHIAGLLDSSDSGTVEINGSQANTGDLSTKRLNDVGFVYQQHLLLNNFNARENVAMPKLIANNSRKDSLESADFLLDALGLYSRRNHLPTELSGGEQQRVAIARCLINQPKIIMADEPTGNLDPQTANEVFEIFLRLAEEEKIALLMVTHNHVLADKMNSIYELSNANLTPIRSYRNQ